MFLPGDHDHIHWHTTLNSHEKNSRSIRTAPIAADDVELLTEGICCCKGHVLFF